MNFVEFVGDQQRNLSSPKYMEMLWCTVREIYPIPSVTVEDEELYRNHIPIDFTKFLKKCVSKLRELKLNAKGVKWDDLDEKYFSTLVQYALEQENITLDNALYSANLFVLINTIHPTKRFFYKLTYIKVLEVLKEFNRSQDMTNNIIMFLMDDLKAFYIKISLPEDVVTPTASVLHDYTYCCNDVFENISADVSFENLGYMAFVNFKVLAEHLSKQKNNDKKLFPLLMSLTSSLRTSETNNLRGTVKEAHQKNVRLFIKQNFKLFRSRTFCLVTNMLKCVCLGSECDEYNAVAKIIQQLPCETNQNFMTFFEKTMLCSKKEFRKNLLHYVLPILRHPPEYETNAKRLVRAEIILNNVITLLVEADEEIRGSALRILAEVSEEPYGRRILRKVMAPDNYDDVNKDTIQDVLYEMIDKTWSKKTVNINYIELMCNFLLIRKDLVSIKMLNRIRNLCIMASPYDLKSCIVKFKRLLEYHSCEKNVVIYVLNIMVKQMFHPMDTSTVFAKELHQFIFTNITPNEEDNFIWPIVDILISHNFDAFAIFEKFNSLHLLRDDSVRILMEYKIHERCSRTSALKLLCIMLHYVKYNQTHCLDEKLEASIISDDVPIKSTDLSLVIYALTRLLEKKRPSDCSADELNNYRQMQHLVCQEFFDQMFPIACVKYIIMLLSVYSRLINEDMNWNTDACVHIQEDMATKLDQVCNGSFEHYVYLSRDMVYVGELIILQKTTLTETNFNHLKKIATVSEHTPEFANYLRRRQNIWGLCIALYIKTCFINSELIAECVENLEMILAIKSLNDKFRLQIFFTLYDTCNVHLQYYDPLIPHLFTALYSKNAYMRFIASKIIMQLISEDHLRLIDGQYLLFMSLLADNKSIIEKNMQTFINEVYVKKHQQTIARYIVPSIIHYNFYYDHPTITLSEVDQQLLQKKVYTRNDCCDIYYCLCQLLPESVKFNILNQISNEIIVKIKKDLPHTTEVLRILEDALTVILFTIPQGQIDFIENTKEFFSAGVQYIESELLGASIKINEDNIPQEQITFMKNLLTALFQLLYSGIQDENGKIYQNIVFTIILLTKTFYTHVRRALDNEGSSPLKNLYTKLRQFHTSHNMHFQFDHLSVNPCNLPISAKRENMEFYLQEIKDFSMIAPHVIMGVTNR